MKSPQEIEQLKPSTPQLLLNQLQQVWGHYVREYKFCQQRNQEIPGDLRGYLLNKLFNAVKELEAVEYPKELCPKYLRICYEIYDNSYALFDAMTKSRINYSAVGKLLEKPLININFRSTKTGMSILEHAIEAKKLFGLVLLLKDPRLVVTEIDKVKISGLLNSLVSVEKFTNRNKIKFIQNKLDLANLPKESTGQQPSMTSTHSYGSGYESFSDIGRSSSEESLVIDDADSAKLSPANSPSDSPKATVLQQEHIKSGGQLIRAIFIGATLGTIKRKFDADNTLGVFVNFRDESGRTPLLMALSFQKYNLSSYLIKKGAVINNLKEARFILDLLIDNAASNQKPILKKEIKDQLENLVENFRESIKENSSFSAINNLMPNCSQQEEYKSGEFSYDIYQKISGKKQFWVEDKAEHNNNSETTDNQILKT